MGRELPTDCTDCGGVLYWGDFGPFNEGMLGTICVCNPRWVSVKSKLRLLIEMYRDHHRGVDISERDEAIEALDWVMNEVWMLRAENRELRIMGWLPVRDVSEEIGDDGYE